MSDDTHRFMELKKKAEDLKTKIIRYDEQRLSKESELKKIVAEVKKMGYQPSELKSVIDKKTKELQEKEDAFEKELQEISLKISEIEEG